jgi:hypothetical protein
MTENAITMSLEPSAPRQLGEEGLIILWRDGMKPERREGLACILSICPHPECTCQLVYVDGFVIDAQATEVRWDQEGVHLVLPAGSEPARTMLEARMIAIVDPSSGETEAHPDLPDATDPALIDWLASEMNSELLDVLHRFRARAKGDPPERQRTDIDLDVFEEVHLAAFEELFEGVRNDEYLLGDRRYWACIYLCLYADCDCRQARVAFFDDEEESSDTVGSVLLNLSGAGGFKIEEMEAECGAPEHLIKDLWALFERRYDVGRFLRRRESQFKAVGETLWRPVAKPVRAFPQPGRNAPCPCGSGRKFKKCCLGKDRGSPIAGGSSRSTR